MPGIGPSPLGVFGKGVTPGVALAPNQQSKPMLQQAPSPSGPGGQSKVPAKKPDGVQTSAPIATPTPPVPLPPPTPAGAGLVSAPVAPALAPSLHSGAAAPVQVPVQQAPGMGMTPPGMAPGTLPGQYGQPGVQGQYGSIPPGMNIFDYIMQQQQQQQQQMPQTAGGK